jgi:predicted aminopeptidase
MRSLLRLPFCLLAILAITGCETLGYYAQAIGGQFSLLSRAAPVAELVIDSNVPQDLRERLKLASAIREFAVRELGLPDNGSYRNYAQLERPYAVWNVVATDEFSLQAVQSCFPVAGCVSYRGFFDRDEAERHAAGLRAGGHDVFHYGVAAYSTLGRFDDPLLSTFIRYPEAELARLIFHELTHQLVYVKNDSTFNESLAVAVEREGVRRWLAATGRSAELAAFLEQQRRGETLLDVMDDSRKRLQALYGLQLDADAMRERKRIELAVLREKLQAYPRFKEVVPNNAVVASFTTYTQLVPAFEKLLKDEGGDLKRFYARVRKLAAAGDRPPPVNP